MEVTGKPCQFFLIISQLINAKIGRFFQMAPPGVGSSSEKRHNDTTCANERDIVVLDGGFATQLSCHVSQQIDGDVLWSARFLATDKEAVIDAHLDFLRGIFCFCLLSIVKKLHVLQSNFKATVMPTVIFIC